MITKKIEIEFRVPDEVLEKAKELGISEDDAVEAYTNQLEGFILSEIDFAKEELTDLTIENLSE